MVRLNIDALKAETNTPAPAPVSSVESAVLSVDQVEMAPVSSLEEADTASTEAPSTLDLIESDEVKFGVDFYDNSLANELGNEADIADLMIQGTSETPAPKEAEVSPVNAKLNLVSLASDISEEPTTLVIPEEKKIAFTPKIGKKIEAATPSLNTEVAPEKGSEKIEDFFPNLIVGFEEEDKVEYVREVAKNLSEARKGGLGSLFGKHVILHITIALLTIGGLTAFSIFAVPKIFNSIKGSAFETKKPVIQETIPSPKPEAPTPEAPTEVSASNRDSFTPPAQNSETSSTPPVSNSSS